MAAGGADILNLALGCAPPAPFGQIEDPGAIARLAARDQREAVAALLEALVVRPVGANDWPDSLAADLREEKVGTLQDWAEQAGIAASSVSRGFRLAYGISPQRYRAEQRARSAARSLRGMTMRLADIALDCGFADQPHMTRRVREVFGEPPSRLRAHVKCLQDGKGCGR